MSRSVTVARRPGALARLFGAPRSAQDELEALDAAVRRSIATSRRISFVHLDGGVGCSTVAAGIVSVLASRRRDRDGRVALVDAAGSTRGVAALSGLGDDARVTPASLVRASARRYADAVEGLERTPAGALYVGLGRADSAHWPATREEWADETDGIARFFDVVVTDWGSRPDAAALAGIAESSHAVCVVTSSDRASVERAAHVVPAIAAGRDVAGVVLVIVDRDGRGPTSASLRLDDLPARVVFLPRDRRIARGRRGGRTSGHSSRGFLVVAAALVDAATSARAAVVS